MESCGVKVVCDGQSIKLVQTTLMARVGFTLFALLAILISVYHEIFIKTLLDSIGALTRKKVEMVGNTNCQKVETLQACESGS
jgi:hypothetical protein